MGVPLEDMDAVFGEGESVPQNLLEQGLIVPQRKDLITSLSALPLCRASILTGCRLILVGDQRQTILQRGDGLAGPFTAMTGVHTALLVTMRNRNSRGWMVSRQWRRNYTQSNGHPPRQGGWTQAVMLHESFGFLSTMYPRRVLFVSQHQGRWCRSPPFFLLLLHVPTFHPHA